MALVRLVLGGTYRVFGKVFVKDEEVDVPEEQAKYLEETGHFDVSRRKGGIRINKSPPAPSEPVPVADDGLIDTALQTHSEPSVTV